MAVRVEDRGLAWWLNLEPAKKKWMEELFAAEAKAGEAFKEAHPPPPGIYERHK